MIIEVTEQEFGRIADLLYRETGIYYEYNKKYLIETRLQKRLARLKLTSFSDYLAYLETTQGMLKEKEELLNLLTTNETSFFRNHVQIASYTKSILPEVVRQSKERSRNCLRIWSAASSSGEEIYTLAMILVEERIVPPDWQVELYATDINEHKLNEARQGRYEKYAIRNVPENYLRKYFETVDGRFRIKKEMLPSVRFEKANLIKLELHSSLRDFDIIFCCNVLIYFSEDAKRKAVASLYGALASPGYFFIGHSESLRNVSKDFKLINADGLPVYKKE